MIESSDAETIDIALDAVITQILADISKVKENSGNGLNEAMTETIVIDKLLPVLGYEVWDFQKQSFTSSIGNIPDYTMLPGQKQQWYLEVKRWQLPLKEGEASQAVNYAFNQGKRWAVLTNGDEWRVYDAHSQCQLADKCTLFAKQLSEAKSLLKLLAKNAMLNGEIEKIHHRDHVLQAVRKEICNENSAIIKLLRLNVAKSLSTDVTKQDILDALKELMDSKNEAGTPVIINGPIPTILPIITPSSSGTVSPNPVEKYSLKDLAKKMPSPNGYIPISVNIDCTSSIPVKNWRIIDKTVIEWICSRYGMPDLPYSGRSRDYRVFMSREAVHPDGAIFRDSGEIIINGQLIYFEMHRSAESHCIQIEQLITDMGGDSSKIIVEMVKK